MGVYWNPCNTSYYRSLERSALNVYLATHGTSGTPRVTTPTGINYAVPVPGSCSTPATSKSRPEARPEVEGPECPAKDNLIKRMTQAGFSALQYQGAVECADGETRHYIKGSKPDGSTQARYYLLTPRAR